MLGIAAYAPVAMDIDQAPSKSIMFFQADYYSR
jgi:hypothetical protein